MRRVPGFPTEGPMSGTWIRFPKPHSDDMKKSDLNVGGASHDPRPQDAKREPSHEEDDNGKTRRLKSTLSTDPLRHLSSRCGSTIGNMNDRKNLQPEDDRRERSSV